MRKYALALAVLLLPAFHPAEAQALPGTPYQTTILCNFTAGSYECSSPLPKQKSGTVFLVQTESIYMLNGGGTTQAYIDPEIAGVYTYYALPPFATTGTLYPGISANLSLFIEGQGGLINVLRSDSTSADGAYISLSGYIVTLP